MVKYCVFGAGRNAKVCLAYKGLYSNDRIMGVFDSDKSKWGSKISGYEIENPEKLKKIDFDIMLVSPNKSGEIIEMLIDDYHVPMVKIKRLSEFYRDLCDRLRNKYRDNLEIQHILDSFENYEPDIYGGYQKENSEQYRVFRDDEGFPYVLLDGKRMYYPKNYKGFYEKEGNEFMDDILYEQGIGSPHLYLREGDFKYIDGKVVVDAGVCEGNFSLRYIERLKKVYLIESNEMWMSTLIRTFEPWKEKVVFCNKYLSSNTNRDNITLDNLVDEPIDFLKMDIEGYETDTSDGYMLFMHDLYFCDTLDFRRGIVYAKRRDNI